MIGFLFGVNLLGFLFYGDALLKMRVVSPTERADMEKMRNQALLERRL